MFSLQQCFLYGSAVILKLKYPMYSFWKHHQDMTIETFDTILLQITDSNWDGCVHVIDAWNQTVVHIVLVLSFSSTFRQAWLTGYLHSQVPMKKYIEIDLKDLRGKKNN